MKSRKRKIVDGQIFEKSANLRPLVDKQPLKFFQQLFVPIFTPRRGNTFAKNSAIILPLQYGPPHQIVLEIKLC